MTSQRNQKLIPPEDRGPLRVMFLLTSLPIGGAETLLRELVRRLDADRFAPEICCLKQPGPLGEQLAEWVPVHSGLIRGKYDFAVLGRLTRLMQTRRIDAAITVGCGDKMFWGRLAAWRAGVPVIAAALHSTGWPDGVGNLNRLLTSITDAFIAVAPAHGQHLIRGEGFPAAKVHVIPNGVDTERFYPAPDDRTEVRRQLQLPSTGPLACIVAALRPEKNHARFLRAAQLVQQQIPQARFLIVGDGPLRYELESLTRQLDLTDCVQFLGSRSNIPDILRACDAFVLTSDNEAAPVSILEAMSSGLPIVASDVGSIHEMVRDGKSGFLVPLQPHAFAQRLIDLFQDRTRARQMGQAGRRQVLQCGSLRGMVDGYEQLITDLYRSKSRRRPVPWSTLPIFGNVPTGGEMAGGQMAGGR